MSTGSAGFQKVANKQGLKEGGLLGIELNGNKVVLAMVEGKVYAWMLSARMKADP